MDSNILIALITGVSSSAATVAVLRNDMSWLKKEVNTLKAKVEVLERKG